MPFTHGGEKMMQRRRVVLPDPLGPNMTSASLLRTARLAPSSILTALNCLRPLIDCMIVSAALISLVPFFDQFDAEG